MNKWYHIVEQCQAKATRSGFSVGSINTKSNVIALDKATHDLVSKHYSTLSEYDKTKIVRDWLNGKSFEFQYGVNYLREIGVTIP
ncbi:MAG: hypothetical protein LBM02_08910 [Lachnospiraceae bacterium]|nr:hypothetical protein [Lachnospiraceae bacterium]